MIENDKHYSWVMYPARTTIAGCRLLPFSIGHALMLTRFGSPFVDLWQPGGDGTRKIALGDLALALWICSRQSTEAMGSIGSWWSRHSIKKIGRRLAKASDADHVSQFVMYVVGGLTSPRVRKPSTSKDCASPLLGILKLFVMDKLHLSHAEALNYPMSLAFWDRAISLDTLGFVNFMTQVDLDREEHARKLGDPEEIKRLFGIVGDENGE